MLKSRQCSNFAPVVCESAVSGTASGVSRVSHPVFKSLVLAMVGLGICFTWRPLVQPPPLSLGIAVPPGIVRVSVGGENGGTNCKPAEIGFDPWISCCHRELLNVQFCRNETSPLHSSHHHSWTSEVALQCDLPGLPSSPFSPRFAEHAALPTSNGATELHELLVLTASHFLRLSWKLQPRADGSSESRELAQPVPRERGQAAAGHREGAWGA